MNEDLVLKTFENDEAVLAAVNEAFGGLPRPDKFTAEDGDPECMLHDEMWHRVTPETISIEDVFPELSFPYNELLSEGVAYYLPAITRLVLADDRTEDWSGVPFVDGVLCRLKPEDCSGKRANVVLGVMRYIIDHKSHQIDDPEEVANLEKVILRWQESIGSSNAS